MHDIWNPWHGCRKCSPGCDNCYMYYLDKKHDVDSAIIAKTKTGFNYPMKRCRDKSFKVKSGEILRVCMTSDFFIEEADIWRPEAWEMMKIRTDVGFCLLTKRAERIKECLPPDWGEGYPNVALGVTTENQEAADFRVPILLDLPTKRRHITCAPLIGPIDLTNYLDSDKIHRVIAGGENYDGARLCDIAWMENLREQCRRADVAFYGFETGTSFLYQERKYHVPNKQAQSRYAFQMGLRYIPSNPPIWNLRPMDGSPIEPHPKATKPICATCARQFFCNGCSDCGKCS